MEPIGIAYHDDDSVLAISSGQVAGDLGRQILGGNSNVKLAAFDLLFSRSCTVGISSDSAVRLREDAMRSQTRA
jgi:hypothetical protein